MPARFSDQKALLNPILDVKSENVGNNIQVGVKVLDERPEKILGYRGAASVSKGGVITTDQEVAEVFSEKIKEGLTIKGFQPTSYSDDISRTLKIEIRSLEYYTSTGFWTGGIHTKASLKAIAQNSGKEYEEYYRGGNEERIMVVPSAEENDNFINIAVSEVLEKLFNDKKLFEFLGN